MKTRLASILLVLFSLTPPLCAQDSAHKSRTVQYTNASIVDVAAAPHMTTIIVLPEKEKILDFVIGNSDLWKLEGAANFALLKPSKTGISTSIDLITEAGNIYTFFASADTRDPDLKVFIEVTDEKLLHSLNSGSPTLVRASEVAQITEMAQAQVSAAKMQTEEFRAKYPVEELKHDYVFKANDRRFKVSGIYHDDKFTYIECGAQEKPTLYEIKDGKPNLIDYTLDKGVFVAPKVLDSGYLSIGKKRLSFERKGS